MCLFFWLYRVVFHMPSGRRSCWCRKSIYVNLNDMNIATLTHKSHLNEPFHQMEPSPQSEHTLKLLLSFTSTTSSFLQKIHIFRWLRVPPSSSVRTATCRFSIRQSSHFKLNSFPGRTYSRLWSRMWFHHCAFFCFFLYDRCIFRRFSQKQAIHPTTNEWPKPSTTMTKWNVQLFI